MSITKDIYYKYDNPPVEDRRTTTSPNGTEVQIAVEMTTYDDDDEAGSKYHSDSRHVIELPHLGTDQGTEYRALPGVDYSQHGWTHIVMTTFWRRISGYWIPSNNTKRIQELKDYDNMSFCERLNWFLS